MLRSGIRAKQLIVQHVRKPCKRVPVGRVPCRKCPLDSGPRQTILDNAIFCNVFVIVIICKTAARRRQISQQRDEREQQTNETRTKHRVLCRRFCRAASAETKYIFPQKDVAISGAAGRNW